MSYFSWQIVSSTCVKLKNLRGFCLYLEFLLFTGGSQEPGNLSRQRANNFRNEVRSWYNRSKFDYNALLVVPIFFHPIFLCSWRFKAVRGKVSDCSRNSSCCRDCFQRTKRWRNGWKETWRHSLRRCNSSSWFNFTAVDGYPMLAPTITNHLLLLGEPRSTIRHRGNVQSHS